MARCQLGRRFVRCLAAAKLVAARGRCHGVERQVWAMGPLTPRLSYDEYLQAEEARTGLTRKQIVARDKKDSAAAFKRARKSAADLDAKRAADAAETREDP
jgi:hypothetical protein